MTDALCCAYGLGRVRKCKCDVFPHLSTFVQAAERVPALEESCTDLQAQLCAAEEALESAREKEKLRQLETSLGA